MSRLPIFHDDKSFRDRTEQMFRDMQLQMDHDMMRGFGSGMPSNWPSMQPSWVASSSQPAPSVTLDQGFFQLRPRLVQSTQHGTKEERRGSREILDDSTVSNLFVEDPEKKNRLFQMSFDVKNYDPEVIQVRVEDNCLIVEAKQTEIKDGAKINKEFCRKIQLPSDVEAEKLSSTLSSDGILSIKAPVPPRYQSVTSSVNQPKKQHIPLGGENLLFGSSPFPPMRVSPLTIQMQGAPAQFPADNNGINPSSFGTTTHQSVQIQSQGNVMQPCFQRQQQLGGPYTIPVLSCVPVANIQCKDRPVFTITDSGKHRMDLVLELGRPYNAADVVVKLDKKKLIVEAVHEESDAMGRVSKSSMQKEFDLPHDIDPSSIRAMMQIEGQLTITAMAFN